MTAPPANTSPLMISVAGVRGIVGLTLTPPVLTRFAAAFARELGDGPIVVGRDARLSGPMVLRAVAAGVTAAGRAPGGISPAASHTPAPWNALEFLSSRVECLGPSEGQAVRERFEADRDLW